jgi:heat shock protein HtpX
MAHPGEHIPWRTRVPPAILLLVAGALVAGWLRAWSVDQGAVRNAPWWVYLFLVLLAVAMEALAGAVTIDPRPLALRRALAGTALAWTVILAGVVGAVGLGDEADRPIAIVVIAVLGAVTVALAGIGLTTDAGSLGGEPDWIARFGAILIFAAAIVMATGVVVGAISVVRAVWRSVGGGLPLERLPWVLVIVVVVLPLVTFGLASILTRRANGGTFWAQAAANRRNSLLLVITLVGVVAATAEIIAASLTFRAMPALGAAVVAAGLGLLIALIGNRFGSRIILETAGARPADPKTDAVLINVVRELALAADVPMPAVYVITDGSQNAFATGRDPQHAAVAVTSGLVERMDREQLQGVIAHELGHIRNLDTRYALFVAVLVGLVALVTDGFLQLVVEGWKQGAFFWKGDDKSALATLAMGILVGLFLLIVAALLRVVAPLFSALVQASTSREREFLADATSVEFTRNPRALERALASIASDADTLEAANRGTQHLWFRNPVQEGSDRRAGLLSTHPSLGARIDRLRALQGLDPIDPRAAERAASET